MLRSLCLIALLVIPLAAGCAKPTTPPPASNAPGTTTEEKNMATVPGKQISAEEAARKLGTATDKPLVKAASGLEYIDMKVGSGAAATAGNPVTVHYTGWLVNGTKFDSSVDKNRPFAFALGAGQVIRGWDEGVAGMKPGGVRKLIIPSNLGYGDNGAAGVIPPGATLIFEVQLLKIG